MCFVTRLLILSLLLLYGCGSDSIKFDPIFHRGDYINGQIVPREPYPIVSCYEPKFAEYSCMHIDKIKELKEILIRARLPKKYKKKVIQILNEINGLEKSNL